MNRRSRMLAAWGLLMTGAMACDANEEQEPTPPANEAPTGISYVRGAAKVTDAQNGIVVDVPAGWYAIVPNEGQGTLTLASYDMNNLENMEPHQSSHRLSEQRAKIDITAVMPEPGQTVEQFVQQRLSALGSEGPDGVTAQVLPSRDMLAYSLAGRQGRAYKFEQGQETALEVALPWDNGQVLLINIVPAHTEKLAEALSVLEQVRTPAQELTGQRPPVREGAGLVAPLRLLPTLVQAFGACSGWTGSDSGSIAPTTPITINLPFYVGTRWRAGGAGSFWGNHYHGNCNNDYYAIDFNRVNANCSYYIEDAGQNVYSVANGTAYVYPNSTQGYGNYVDVVHSSGIKTRYAHLQAIRVAHGAAVTARTVVGLLGTTGNSSAPHLHFGYYQNGYSRCRTSSGRCPNGEAASSVQSAKPSPMHTYHGSRTMVDAGCYTAP